MKNTICFIMLVAMILILTPSESEAQYYYSDNREISLGIDSMKAGVAHSLLWVPNMQTASLKLHLIKL